MENITDLLAPRNLPLELGELGTVTEAELIMPGVYDAILECSETGLAVEAFIVLSNAGEISAAAKRYGKTDSDYPDLLVYSENETGNTRYIVGYELFRYKILHHLPLLEGETIRGIAAVGAEMYPDYFGRYPVPFHTPWGCTTRHKIIANGLEKSGSRTLTDSFLSATTTIQTPVTVWRAIAGGEVNGSEALMRHQYRVDGDFDLLLNWDNYFAGTGDAAAPQEEKKAAPAGGIHTPVKATSLNILLIPWIVFWAGASIHSFWGSLASLGACVLVPLVFYQEIWRRSL